MKIPRHLIPEWKFLIDDVTNIIKCVQDAHKRSKWMRVKKIMEDAMTKDVTSSHE